MILKRIRQASDGVLAAKPDVLVIIDSPDFTQRVAKRVRARDPSIPIVDYVSPTVWAWRPGRARAISRYVDQLMALLPFEPEVHRRLGGPPCTYVGHPLLEQLEHAAARRGRARAARARRGSGRSARQPRQRSSPPYAAFGETLAQLRDHGRRFEPVLPALPHLADLIREHERVAGRCSRASWSATTNGARRFARRGRRWQSPAR